MLSPIRTRWVGLAGLVGLLPIAWGMVQGTLALDQAGLRAVVLLVVLAIVDHLVLPIAGILLGPPKRRTFERGGSA